MTPPPTKDAVERLVERLREESISLSGRAWSRQDGGQELSLAAILLDTAADTLTAANARIAELEGWVGIDAPAFGNLHRVQHCGTPAVKVKLGGSIIQWAADEIIALRRAQWLRDHGWIQAPDQTWGLPQSTCRSVSTEAAYALGTIIADIDEEDARTLNTKDEGQ